MAEETLFWKVKVNGNWVTMKSPSTMDYDWEDLDDDSYRNVIDGVLIRNRVRNHVIKLSLTFNAISNSEVNTICSAVNSSPTIEVQAKAPAFGNMTSSEDVSWYEFTAYVSKLQSKSQKLRDGSVANTLSFNVIEV